MATGERSGSDHLTHFRRLVDSPGNHHIFMALRIIEAQFDDRPRMGESRRPHEDRMRLGQEPRMAFPPTTISAVKASGAAPGKLTNRFFGFFGPHGPLPIHMTEYARERQINHRDASFVGFADMLTHRMMSLLYRAWVTGEPAVDFDRGAETGFSRHVAALAGYHGAGQRNRDAMPDLAKRHFTGLLSTNVKNAEGLVAILSGFLDAPVRMQEFVGSWLELEPDDRWQLGSGGGLGQTTSIGMRVWTRNAKFRLIVGPVSSDAYERLLPGQPTMEKLAAIVRNYVGDALDFDVNLVLKARDVKPTVLGQGTRLGHTSWLGKRRSTADADDLFLEPRHLETQVA